MNLYFFLHFDVCFVFCKSIHFMILDILQVIKHFDGCKADLVVCDGAPDGRMNSLVLNFSYL